jgi:CheY-like chemotaxis protein
MDIKKATILLVDDEPFLREIMAGWLERVAGRVVCAEDGADALRILAEQEIDLILSDVRMPVMDGIALLKNIGGTRNGAPGVIFITGFSDVPLREAYDMGVEAILEKPITREELVKLAARALADADELWQGAPSAALEMKLKSSFTGLATALAERRIAFGRRGFCVETAGSLHEGLVEFVIEFKDDWLVLSGQGLVRWTAPEESKAGIEITWLDDTSRDWMVDYVERNKPVAFIPGLAELDSPLQANIA